MTNFNDWDERTPKNFPASLNNLSSLLRQAYEAGAASESETLRDKFAAQLKVALRAEPEYSNSKSNEIYAARSYKMADAMLEARKVKGEET